MTAKKPYKVETTVPMPISDRAYRMGERTAWPLTSELGASAVGEAVARFWRMNGGYKVRWWVEQVRFSPGSRTWVTKTDLVNGLPRGYRKPAKELVGINDLD